MNRIRPRPEHTARAVANVRRLARGLGLTILLAGAPPAAADSFATTIVPAVEPVAPLRDAPSAETPAGPIVRTERAALRVVTVATGLEHPWGLAFLPDGRALLTERAGRLRLLDRRGRLSPPLPGVPAVHAAGQGGLLDVTLSPSFATDRTVFLSYAEPGPRGSRTAVARARLVDTPDASAPAELRDGQVIFRQQPGIPGNMHFGSRLAFGRDGLLWITMGERYTERARAQSLDVHLGKVVRIRPDGTPPPDNPFAGRAGALPEIWSLGHRNVQGAAVHPQTGLLWTHEHGARGGDEINVTRPGRNYGWPVITHGVDYTGLPIGEGREKPGMETPLYQWTPSIAPSGMAFVTSDAIPGWRGNLLVGSLKFAQVVRLELDGERVVHEERIAIGDRVRDVRIGPDGLPWLLTDVGDGRGRVLRLEPAAPGPVQAPAS